MSRRYAPGTLVARGLLAAGLLLCAVRSADAAQEHPVIQQHTPAHEAASMKETTASAIGKRFPEVVSETLAKTPVRLPDDARGLVTLIAISFLHQNQAQLDSWLEPFGAQYGGRAGFTFYEVPMISAGYRFMRLVIDGGMRGGIPEDKHKNVVTMYGDVEHYSKELNIDPRAGHVFLLDRQGIVRWQGQGFATPELLQELCAAADRLALNQ